MGSISKRRSNIEDRISNLPPCLISHILSFLPTVEAVRSSVLSTFWRRQWTSITRLSFDYNLPRTSLVALVYHVLLYLKVTHLDVFELVWSQRDDDTTHINAWFAVALSRHVRRLVVDVRRYVEDPLLLHSCTTLEVLDLGHYFTLSVPSSISLVSMRTLRLRRVNLLDDESFARLVSSCPVLEELDLQEGLGMYVKTINISSTTLKRLIISFSWDLYCHGGCFDSKIVINTPSLQYFEYSDVSIAKGYKFQNIPFLDMARINVDHGDDDDGDELDDNLAFKRFSDLAAGISSVRILRISKSSFEALSRSPSQLPTFRHLTTLKIEGLKSTGWRLLMAFLASSPQLANLSFEAVTSEDDSLNWSKHFEEIYVPHIGVPYCMMFSLEVIEVNEVKWSEVELEIMRYFLKQSNCLKKLIIYNSNRDYWKGRMPMVREKVLKFPRSSPSCEVVLMGD